MSASLRLRVRRVLEDRELQNSAMTGASVVPPVPSVSSSGWAANTVAGSIHGGAFLERFVWGYEPFRRTRMPGL